MAENELRPGRKPPATIYDVARLAGVSPSTVSRALNKPGRIAAPTEQRIRDAAAELGYRLNPMARALPTGRSGTLALILTDITNPVYFDLVRGAERVTAELGHTLVIAESRESAATELATAQRLQPSVDGEVLVGSRLNDEQIRELSTIKPIVTVNRRVSGVPAVVPDAEPGIAAALDHLVQLGHRAVGFLPGPVASWMSRNRWQTLVTEAAPRGMTLTKLPPADPTIDGGAASLDAVLTSAVTAVIAYNDLMAIGLLQAARGRAIAVPGRLSVIGFDDIFGADLVAPALTTIRSPLGLVGELAIGALLADIDGAEPGPESGTLATELVVRGSTGPAALPPSVG